MEAYASVYDGLLPTWWMFVEQGMHQVVGRTSWVSGASRFNTVCFAFDNAKPMTASDQDNQADRGYYECSTAILAVCLHSQDQ